MKNIKIVCDSLSDIPKDLINKYDIHVVPLTVIFDGVEYIDGVDISKEDFYKMLRNSSNLPKTSQATYTRFKDAFDKYIAEGKQILYIGGSSVASGTYQSAILATNDIEEKIYTFDTKNLSIGASQFVLKAAKMIEEGKDIEEILNTLESLKDKIKVVFSVDTLEYLQKGGRVSMAQATVGNLLNIKPILGIANGTVEPVAKIRGKRQVVAKMIDLIQESFGDDLSNNTLILGCGDNTSDLEDLKIKIMNKMNVKEVIMMNVGTCICAHTGPSLLGISCL